MDREADGRKGSRPSVPPLSVDEEALISGGGYDSLSSNEAKQLSSKKTAEELQEEQEQNEQNRREKFRDHFEFIAVASMYGIWALLMISGLIWVFHLLAPACWQWLNAEQIKMIQTIITGGALAGIASGHLKKRLN